LRILLKKFPEAWLAILVGLVAFVSITGGKIICPEYVDWLMEGDPAQHWLGWQFFRHSPLFQWPIGSNPNFGLDIGSSVVFSDSVPLLAFFFKLFSPYLPDTFQYTGLWILICFLLQSIFAWKLLSLFTQDKWLPLIGSVFFTLAPACLWRLHGHYALFGHWVLLAGFYFYFSKKFSILRWIGLLVVTALIHAYLLVMVFAIWIADLIQRSRRKEAGTVKLVCYFLGGSASTTIVMWAAGYFMIDTGALNAGGFGVNHMNLLSLINPDANYPGADWSKLLRDQKGKFGDYEGFNYLGLGMLGLALVAGYELVRNIKTVRSIKMDYDVRVVPVLILSIGLFLYAISNHIAMGAHEIFSYNLPSITEPFTNAFRASGRFFWPVYYLIYLAIFYLIFSRLERSVAITLCAVLLFVQIIDSSDALRFFRNKFTRAPAWSSPMRAPLWSDIARHYRKIIFVLPHNSPTNWMPLAHFAATNRMAINIGCFARVNQAKERNARKQVAASIINDDLSPDSLYIFEDDELWRVASNQIAPSDIAGVLDGFRIVAPKLRDCSTCNMRAIASVSVGSGLDSDYEMERISFTSKGTGQKYAMYGWSVPGECGTWSDGDTAAIFLKLSAPPKRDLNLFIKGHAFVIDKHPEQQIDVLLNKHVLETLKYNSSSHVLRIVRIPKSLALEKEGCLLIEFRFKDAKSPAELGLWGDERSLGLEIVWMQLKLAKEYFRIYTRPWDRRKHRRL
jgi:hypothetical protein